MQSQQLREFHGFRPTEVFSRVRTGNLTGSGYTNVARSGRSRLTVESFKKSRKKKQRCPKIVMLEDVDKVGKKGELVTVALGYWRNYLQPFRKAEEATPAILANIQAEQDAIAREKQEIKDRASRLALALRTIGKFVIKKKAGEGGTIFGSVTKQDIFDAVYQQTGQELDKREINVPEIKAVGSYQVSVKLHPEVVGTFNLIVTQEKNAPGRR